MADKRVLASNNFIQVETCTEVDDELMAHISSAILGTPGRMRYQLTRIGNKLAHMKEIYFVLLRMRSFLLGSIGFNRRITYANGQKYQSWYIRYFYINAPFRSKQQKKDKYRDPSKGSNAIRDAALPYMREPALLLPEEYNPKKKNLVYGYIESMNFRSKNFSEQSGGETVRKFNTLIFNRLSLKACNSVRRLEKNEVDSFRVKVVEFYRNYTLFTLDNLFFNGNYFIYEKGNEILAGIQVHPESWKVLEMPGNTNKILLKMLPSLPYIRRFFNPKDFRFLALEGVYFKEGGEIYLESLIESVCKHFKTYFALLWVDSDSELIRILDKNVNYGIIGRSFERIEVDVRVTFNNFTEEEKKVFYENPVYISAYDSV